jgi:hypothetical protein
MLKDLDSPIVSASGLNESGIIPITYVSIRLPEDAHSTYAGIYLDPPDKHCQYAKN